MKETLFVARLMLDAYLELIPYLELFHTGSAIPFSPSLLCPFLCVTTGHSIFHYWGRVSLCWGNSILNIKVISTFFFVSKGTKIWRRWRRAVWLFDRSRGALQEEPHGRNIGHSTATQAGERMYRKAEVPSLHRAGRNPNVEFSKHTEVE